MVSMNKRWYRSRRNQIIIIVFLILGLIYYASFSDGVSFEANLDITRSTVHLSRLNLYRVVADAPLGTDPDITHRASIIDYIENKIQEQLKLDKGTGCEIPHLDPFSPEVMQFDKDLPKVECSGKDWVKCRYSECQVVKDILDSTKDIVCTYWDILHQNDYKYTIGNPLDVYGADKYVLSASDHVKIKCTGKHGNSIFPSKWTGYAAGFRSTVKPNTPPEGREGTINVLIFGFDSTSRNGFIRRMPKSYKFLTEELHATILKGYNIVGDGTPAAIFPILTGKNELELPDVRKKVKYNTRTLDEMPFIFYKLKEDGYRTAYFEDMPWIGTFQYRFNGFKRQPADHYLRSFFLEESANGKRWRGNSKYCVGDTPQYMLMMNLTTQFLGLDGKRFCFTFIADICHDDFNKISTADDAFADFMRQFRDDGRLKDTLLIVMGDHGSRYAKVRDTLQGKLEERLPLMAIVLPEQIKVQRPEVQGNLQANADVLTTPHDIHATLLDALGMTQHWNDYKVRGADLTRGLTLFQPIPKNRSCSEAGIEPHWCACLSWKNVSEHDPLYKKTAKAFVDFINSLTQPVRSKCIPRTLTSIAWVMRQRANSHMLSFIQAKDADGYVGKFGANVHVTKENYQIKVVVGPGRGVYEASMTYLIDEDKFDIDSRDISRTNAYNDEPHCISATHPHLNMYCYCADAD